MDQLLVWNQALDSTDVSYLWNGGNGRALFLSSSYLETAGMFGGMFGAMTGGMAS
jgi:hypothetical protein